MEIILKNLKVETSMRYHLPDVAVKLGLERSTEWGNNIDTGRITNSPMNRYLLFQPSVVEIDNPLWLVQDGGDRQNRISFSYQGSPISSDEFLRAVEELLSLLEGAGFDIPLMEDVSVIIVPPMKARHTYPTRFNLVSFMCAGTLLIDDSIEYDPQESVSWLRYRRPSAGYTFQIYSTGEVVFNISNETDCSNGDTGPAETHFEELRRRYVEYSE